MPPRRATRNTRAKAPATLSPEDQQVIEAFWNNPTHPTNIVKLTQMHSYETSATCSWRTLTSSARTSKQRQSERQRQQQTPSPPSTGSLSSHSSRSKYLSTKTVYLPIWDILKLPVLLNQKILSVYRNQTVSEQKHKSTFRHHNF